MASFHLPIAAPQPIGYDFDPEGISMGVPVSQMYAVASYIIKQKASGRKRYPLVLMLEPLFRCNLACAGCGKIQYPAHILRQHLSPEQCFKAADECGAPMVSIPGGEPLLHPQIAEIVEGLIDRRKYVYLCTNALILKEKLHLLPPEQIFSRSTFTWMGRGNSTIDPYAGRAFTTLPSTRSGRR